MAAHAVDFASIEEMDPSVADGFRVIYDREVPFELRLQESAEGPNDVGTLEAIKVCAAMMFSGLKLWKYRLLFVCFVRSEFVCKQDGIASLRSNMASIPSPRAHF